MQQENLKKRNEIKKAKQTVIGKQMCTRGKYTSFYRKKSNVKMKKFVEKNEKSLVFTYKMQSMRGKTRK
jgi:hypothetical protein